MRQIRDLSVVSPGQRTNSGFEERLKNIEAAIDRRWNEATRGVPLAPAVTRIEHMATAETRLTEWLRDAQAMEKQATTMLDALAKGIENTQMSKRKLERHLQEAREQAAALQGYVEQRGEGMPIG